MAPGPRPLLLCLLLTLNACGVTEVVDSRSDGRAILIRAPQPSAEDLATLRQRHGLRTVVNLRGIKPERSWFKEEQRGVEAIDARWVHLTTSGTEAPPPELVERFLDIVDDPANWPVLIHCQGGIHRTGLLTAIYRIERQGWSRERAIRDMEDHYFDWGITNRRALKDYLRQYEPAARPSRRSQ